MQCCAQTSIWSGTQTTGLWIVMPPLQTGLSPQTWWWFQCPHNLHNQQILFLAFFLSHSHNLKEQQKVPDSSQCKETNPKSDYQRFQWLEQAMGIYIVSMYTINGTTLKEIISIDFNFQHILTFFFKTTLSPLVQIFHEMHYEQDN